MNHLRPLALLAFGALLSPIQSTNAQSVAYEIHAPRQSTGLAFFDGETFAGITTIQYGAPGWKDEYDALVASDRSGSFRLGKDAWASIEVGLPMVLGGQQVAPGHYGLALRRDAKGDFALLLIDFAVIRRERVLPNQPDAVEPTTAIALGYGKADAMAKELTLRLASSEQDARAGKLTVHWGTHRLTASWTAPKVHPRQQAFDAAIAGMLTLLDSKNYEQLIRTYAEPEFLAEHEDEIGDVVEDFASDEDKPNQMRDVLLEVQRRNVVVGADQELIELEVQGAPGDEISFRFVDGRWRVRDR